MQPLKSVTRLASEPIGKLKVLINAVAAKSGGAATYIENLARHLAEIQSQHCYVFYVPRSLANVIKGLSDNVVAVETSVGYRPFWRRFLWDQFVLRNIIKDDKFDILVSSSDFGMVFPPCRQVLLIRNSLFFSQLYFQYIVPRQSWNTWLGLLLRRGLILASAKFSDMVVLASRAMLNEVQHFAPLPFERISVNNFGVPLERFATATKTNEEARECSREAFRILYVSEYGDYKNFTTLFKAVKELSGQGVTDFTLVTTADPWQSSQAESVTREEDQALAAHPLVASFVKCAGYVPYEAVPELYANSDLFVFPSIAESFGHPLVEAMASGLPVLASDIPLCREICGEAAIYFSPFDAQDLAEKLIRLRRDNHLRRQLGEAGRKRAETHFDWNDHVRRLVELIEQVGADA